MKFTCLTNKNCYKVIVSEVCCFVRSLRCKESVVNIPGFHYFICTEFCRVVSVVVVAV